MMNVCRRCQSTTVFRISAVHLFGSGTQAEYTASIGSVRGEETIVFWGRSLLGFPDSQMLENFLDRRLVFSIVNFDVADPLTGFIRGGIIAAANRGVLQAVRTAV